MDGSDPNGNVACDEPGPYHADPDAEIVNPDLLSGCAIGSEYHFVCSTRPYCEY